MNIEKAEQLAMLLRDSNCTQLSVTEGDTVIKLKKAASKASRRPAAVPEARRVSPEKTSDVRADMVGIFSFSAPLSPGDTVEEGQLIGHIRSFTIVNDIKAPCGGTVVSVSCEDDSPVEYGQVILVIKE
ncbi:MAG: hypothetical protein ILO36_00695 [Abditibacteriota bacterium]|nr:hypothetical protein [Abditibacteriota bacterium]